MQFLVADFSAIEARVIAWYAGESWRQKVFEKGGDIYCASASQMFKVPVEKHGINGHLRQKGKIAELALGYGGSVGALKAMGAIDMGLTEDELPPLVDAWRQANPQIVKFWWAVDHAVMEAVRYKHTTTDYGLTFSCRSGILFITLPSGRNLAYVKPKVGTNKFGGECITYEGVGATKKWERLESYGPKFVENIVQATARDILCYAMRTLRCCSIVIHIHDELVIEANPRMSLDAVCEQMGRTPPWANYIRFWQASGESEKTAIRVKTKHTQMVQEGQYRGGHIPFGYKLEHQGRTNKKNQQVRDLVVDEDEAIIVREIFDLLTNHGYGTNRVAQLLNDRGIKTKRGTTLWRGTTIRSLIENPIYIGIYHMQGVQSEPFEHLKIIDEDLYAKCLQTVKGRSTSRCCSKQPNCR